MYLYKIQRISILKKGKKGKQARSTLPPVFHKRGYISLEHLLSRSFIYSGGSKGERARSWRDRDGWLVIRTRETAGARSADDEIPEPRVA